MNTIGRILKGIAIVSFVIGIIGGIIVGTVVGGGHDLNIPVMLAVWFGCFVEGMFFFALSEIIQLAEDRNTYLEKISDTLSIAAHKAQQNASDEKA